MNEWERAVVRVKNAQRELAAATDAMLALSASPQCKGRLSRRGAEAEIRAMLVSRLGHPVPPGVAARASKAFVDLHGNDADWLDLSLWRDLCERGRREIRGFGRDTSRWLEANIAAFVASQ